MTDALEEDYQNAGFGTAIELGAYPGLVIIDFVEAYLGAGSPSTAKARIPWMDLLHFDGEPLIG